MVELGVGVLVLVVTAVLVATPTARDTAAMEIPDASPGGSPPASTR